MTVRRVTLTFDNGPTPGITEHVLDELARRELRASFFVIGERLATSGAWELSERATAEGHWIGNHTLTHSVQFGEASAQFAMDEIEGAQRVIGSLTHRDKLFRPYGGGGVLSQRLLRQSAVDYLLASGFTCVLWNCVPRDWEDVTGWPETALAKIAQQDWTVVVVHDEAHGSMLQLPRFLDALARTEVEFRQDFPDSVMPIKRGRLQGPLDHLTVDAGPPRP